MIGVDDGRSPETATAPRRRAGSLAVELAVLGLVLASMAGTAALVVIAQTRPRTSTAAPAPAAVEPPPVPPQPPEPPPEPRVVVAPPPTVDVTDEVVGQLDRQQAETVDQAQEVEGRLDLLAYAKDAARTQKEEAEKRATERQRETALLSAEAERLGAEAELLGMEVDVLERRKAELQENLQRAKDRPGYSILPYKGANGTWHRPVPIECRGDEAIFPPDGPAFSLFELSPLQGPDTPFATAIIRLAAHVQAQGAPDGAQVTPYVLFVVRPDGIRPFYEARGRLEALDIPYGYELVEQDTPIEYPRIDDPSIWGEISELHDQAALAARESAGGGIPIAGFGDTGSPDGTTVPPGLFDDPNAPFPPAAPSPGHVSPPRSFNDLLAEDSADPRQGPRGLPAGGTVAGTTTPGRPRGARTGMGSSPARPTAGDPLMTGAPSTPSRSLPGGPAGPGSSPIGTDELPMPPSLDESMTGRPPSTPPALPNVFQGLAEVLARRGAGNGGQDEPSTTPPGAGTSATAGTSRPIQQVGRVDGLGSTDGANSDSASSLPAPPQAARSLEIVVACSKKGLVVHPGGYRLPVSMMKKEPQRLVATLRHIVRLKTNEWGVEVLPRLRFLVDGPGEEVYWMARRRVAVDLPDWPMDWQVSEPRQFSPFGPDRW